MRPLANRATYRCSGRDENQNGCEERSIPRDKVDAALRAYFMEHIFDPDATRAEFDAERSRALAEARQDAKQSATEATLQAGRRQRIMGLMQDGDLSASDWKVQDAALERRSTRPPAR
jgi:hypothetical protein